jgi:hypothetical protein
VARVGSAPLRNGGDLRSFFALALVFAVAALGYATAVRAFPPYRSTDAETAPPGTLETRLGLLRVEREDHDSHYTSPLLRVNLGIPHDLELISELEYDLEGARLGDGAVGLKWAPPRERLSFGIETLALLPVSSQHAGLGVEAQALATLRRPPFRFHANAGGFHDPRPDDTESGWRASLLAEWERGPARLGAEVFAKQVEGDGAEVLAGPGVIWSLGPLDVRAALHAGLTAEAPDLVANLWLSTEWRLW